MSVYSDCRTARLTNISPSNRVVLILERTSAGLNVNRLLVLFFDFDTAKLRTKESGGV